MNDQITRKQLIYNEFIRKFNEGVLTQNEIVDLKQELERCNHIQRHLIRGQENPSARWVTAGIFSFFGFLYFKSYELKTNKKWFYLLLFPATILPGILGYRWGSRRFGNKSEAIRYREQFNEGLKIDEKFYLIANNAKYENLKHI